MLNLQKISGDLTLLQMLCYACAVAEGLPQAGMVLAGAVVAVATATLLEVWNLLTADIQRPQVLTLEKRRPVEPRLPTQGFH